MNIKKVYKKLALASLCLALIICFTACSGGSAPDANGECGDGVKWKYSDKTLEISGTGAIKSYTSSSEAPWANVIATVETIEIESGVTAIGDYAFYGAAKLESIELPATLTSIGNFALAYCSVLEEIELPELVATIGDSAFEGCSSLNSINLGASATGVGSRAFAFCYSLESVSILGDVEIKGETFFNCNALENLILNPSTIEGKIATDAFKNTDFTSSKIEAAKDPNATVTVTVNYVYEDGSEAAASESKADLKIGEAYDIPSPTIDGYVADKLSVSGNAPASDLTVTVTYKAEQTEAESETAAPSETAPVEEEEVGIKGYIALIIMVIIIIGIGVGAVLLKRAEKKREEAERNQNKAKNRKQK